MNPRVSVLLPAYNAALYVNAAINSIEEQTFRDWEIIAVDDASTDETEMLLRARQGPRIFVERNPMNLGMTANWNRCLELASGKLIVKLDADDAFRPHAIEHLVAAFDDREVVATGIRTLLCNPELEPFDGLPGDDAMIRKGIDPYSDTTLPGSRWYEVAAEGNQLWSSSGFMVRSDLLRQIGGWDTRFSCASDTELIWRVLELNRPVAHRGLAGVLYRTRPGSVSDVFRSRGWLTWEGTAGNLLSLSRSRASGPLRRSLRMHYARLWRRWQTSEEARAKLPAEIQRDLNDVMASIAPPPFLDVAMTRLRDALSAA